jgi:hypothetical protein
LGRTKSIWCFKQLIYAPIATTVRMVNFEIKKKKMKEKKRQGKAAAHLSVLDLVDVGPQVVRHRRGILAADFEYTRRRALMDDVELVGRVLDGLVAQVPALHRVVLDTAVEGQDDVALEDVSAFLEAVAILNAVVAVRDRDHIRVRDLDYGRGNPG